MDYHSSTRNLDYVETIEKKHDNQMQYFLNLSQICIALIMIEIILANDKGGNCLKLLKHRLSMFIILLIMIGLITGGCGIATKKPIQPVLPPNSSPPNATPAPMAKVPIIPIAPLDVANKAIAEANKVSGVRAASGFVTDKIIYIGLELTESSDNQSSIIEKKVMNQINSLNLGYAVRVTSDEYSVELIKTVSQGTMQGRPFSDFNNVVHSISIKLAPKGNQLLNMQQAEFMKRRNHGGK